jgi:hypothetical protein
MFTRVFCLFALCFGMLTPLARAHLPLEISLRIQPVADELEITVVLNEILARSLLTPPLTERLTAESLDQNRSQLVSAAPALCTLFDADQRKLPDGQVQVSFTPEGEISFLFLHPASARPASLRVPFLEAAGTPSATFVSLADHGATPPLRAVLMRGRSTHPLASATTP